MTIPNLPLQRNIGQKHKQRRVLISQERLAMLKRHWNDF